MEAKSKSLTAERDEMMGSLKTCTSQKTALSTERDSLKRTNSAIEEKSKRLTSEKEDLSRRLNSCTSQKTALTAERDSLKRTNTDTQEKLTRLQSEFTKQRAELHSNTLQLTALRRERDELQTKLTVFERYSKQSWTYFSGSFYYISTTKKSWRDSQYDCWGKGADLVIIDNKEENAFVRKFQKKLWIGLSDRLREGSWIWQDGTPLRTSFWYPGEPNNFRGTEEDCAETKYYDYENSWNDVECTNANFWMCEKKTGV
uniref:C-type lectin domain-containing protein n=1 Tax=Oryzias latipes TaxID=8090 RepID=A0A3B3I9T0_ORYLA